MYFHIYHQLCAEDSAEIICTEQAAIYLICALAELLSTEKEQQVWLRRKDGIGYYLKIKIDENIANNDALELPYIWDSSVMPSDNSSDTDVDKIEF